VRRSPASGVALARDAAYSHFMRPLRFFRRHVPTFELAGLAAAVVLTLMSSATGARGVALATGMPPAAVAAGEEQDELIGDLVFHADLLSALDRLCPNRNPAPADWHGALRPLLEEALTPELRELSRRLGADAGAQLVQERGGCTTRGFAAAYNESKDEYRTLLQRWRSNEGQ
jgi:hypothetical protein